MSERRHVCSVKRCRRWKDTLKHPANIITMMPGRYDLIGEASEPVYLCPAHTASDPERVPEWHEYPKSSTVTHYWHSATGGTSVSYYNHNATTGDAR